MDFRQIEVFVHVYRVRNFSRAGDALFLTQPTISSHISDLENELGLKLFDRSRRDVIPTEAGDAFYQYAITLLETREKAIYSLNLYSKEVEGRLEIAASSIPSQWLLPRLFIGFRKIYPNVFFKVHQGDSGEVIRDLQKKRFQIGIVGTRMDDDKLEYEVLSKDRLILISARNEEEGCKNPNVSLESLLEKEFIFRESGSGTRQKFETALKEKGINPDHLKVVAEMNSTEAIKRAVREGLGVSVVSSLSAEDYLELGLLNTFTIEGLDLDRTFYLVTHKNQPLSPSVTAFRQYALEYYKK
ncbi:MAG: LysR family transcriptional regulator [Peptococcaceae bacterium]|nr:LysR family transcriptional regulator [Peptococcaceae bacterium]